MNNNNTEIERKYIVRDYSFLNLATAVHHIQQAYLSTDPTIRVRIKDTHAFLTIKGRNPEGSIAHFEWEKEIALEEAKSMLELATSNIIDKHRYIIPWDNLTIEVDVFHKQYEGLVLAEIELPSEDYPLPPLPAFISMEVTDNPQYYNSNLAQLQIF